MGSANILGPQKKHKKKRGVIGKYLFVFSLIAIPLLNFVVFWVYVNIDTIISTFQKFSVRTGEFAWCGFDNYTEVFRDYIFNIGNRYPEKQAVFLNSLNAIAINIIIFPLAFIAAFAFFKKIRHEKYFRICFYLPSIISVSVLTLCYRSLFNSDFGPIALLFSKFGYNPVWLGPDSEQMWPMIYIFSIWAGLSTNVIMMNSAMGRIPNDVMEYARLDGVGFWREAFQIVFPLVLPTVGVYLITIVTSVYSFTMHPMLIAGDPGYNNKFLTVGWYIFDTVATGKQNSMIFASTLGIAVTLLLTPFVIAIRVIVNKCTPNVEF